MENLEMKKFQRTKENFLFMRIVKATKKDKKEAIKIASYLRAWFSKDGLKNMKVDFKLNNLTVAKDRGRVLGFLCYTSYSGKMLLMWMGVKKEMQKMGIGKKLLTWLKKESKKFKLQSINVETLPDEDNYKPYQQTRAFYYKNGFKRILYKKAKIKGWDDQIVLEKKI